MMAKRFEKIATVPLSPFIGSWNAIRGTGY